MTTIRTEIAPMPRWANIATGVPIVMGIALIAGLSFYGSFDSMSGAADKYFEGQGWILPAVVDTAIVVLTAYDLRAIRANVAVTWLRYVIWALNAATIFFNTRASDTWDGQLMHAFVPLVYIVCIEALRHSLLKWMRVQTDRHMEPFTWSMWLTPASTAGMWYRRNRWRSPELYDLNDFLAREQARELLIMRLQAKATDAGKKAKQWREFATADELWAIKTYNLEPGAAMRKTASLISRTALSTEQAAALAPAAPPAPPVRAREEARTLAPAPAPAPAPVASAAAVHTEEEVPAGRPANVTTTKWRNLWLDNTAACTAWDTYRELRTHTGEVPSPSSVHAQSGVNKDRSAVSRWMPMFAARWDAEQAVHTHVQDAHEGVHGDDAHGLDVHAHDGDAHVQDAHSGVHELSVPAPAPPADDDVHAVEGGVHAPELVST